MKILFLILLIVVNSDYLNNLLSSVVCPAADASNSLAGQELVECIVVKILRKVSEHHGASF